MYSKITYSIHIQHITNEVVESNSKKNKSQSMITYDENGQIEDFQEIQTYTKIERRHFRKGDFYMQTFSLDSLILEKKYSITELRTLIALKRRLDFNNRIKGFRQAEIGEEIGSSQANVSRALRQLEKDGIIHKDGIDYYFTKTYIKGAGDK